jgi:hypothetical protein
LKNKRIKEETKMANSIKYRKQNPLKNLLEDFLLQNQSAGDEGGGILETRLITYDIHEESRKERIANLITDAINDGYIDGSSNLKLITESFTSTKHVKLFAQPLLEMLVSIYNDDQRRHLIREFALHKDIGGVEFSESCYAIKTFLSPEELYKILSDHGAILSSNDDVSIHTLTDEYFAPNDNFMLASKLMLFYK